MKYLHLIWAELFRRKTRTILTLVSILAAFLLFGLLNGVRESFDQAGQSAQGAKRLQTSSKLSFIDTLPSSLTDRIARTDGVKDVTYANWFGGAYQKPENQVFSFAVAPNYLDLYPEFKLPAAQKQGIGRSLFSAGANALREAGFSAMRCWVLHGNPAIAFYERMGGERVASKTFSVEGVTVDEHCYRFRLD